jgi:hypothetical protein
MTNGAVPLSPKLWKMASLFKRIVWDSTKQHERSRRIFAREESCHIRFSSLYCSLSEGNDFRRRSTTVVAFELHFRVAQTSLELIHAYADRVLRALP